MGVGEMAWFWLPLCAGLTGVGLVLSFLALRRRGAAAGLRLAAWSLLPLAAYLTDALPTLVNIVGEITGFVAGLVFSPAVWAGVAMAGLSVVLWVVSGVLRSRAQGRAEAGGKAAPGAVRQAPRAQGLPGAAAKTSPLTAPQATRGATPQAAAKPRQAPAKTSDDDFSDIEAILKRRGIS
ncbi:hypothetical protein Misp01_33750 [Microtetraspora sp. NBRC 13810]|uniref:cellulose synthase n=1 Tax=Microtetraspora sp. NBRC 13810 TaxID=3030990 RepID=UPI0024A3B78E|nr:cellulose synthase [Microtetraspora sp. NBRC 13810]GLW08245.1 hypothetical protein Misp01_33750 [Microtetraspora sp. NBRC 13810]